MCFFEKFKAKERADFIKNIAYQLNADYYFGTDSIKDKFNTIWGYFCEKEGNVIVGKIEDYDYYIVEYAKFRGNKFQGFYWEYESRYVIKSKENLPDFYLLPKTNLTSFINTATVFISLAFSIPVIFLVLEKPEPSVFLTALSIIAIIGIILYKAFCHSTEYSNQNKYMINNEGFKNKYIIKNYSDFKKPGQLLQLITKYSDPIKIREVLTDDVCEKLERNYSDIFLSVRGNCVSDLDEGSMEMFQSYGKITSSDSCKYRLNKLLEIVKILEHLPDSMEKIMSVSDFNKQISNNTN